MYFRPSITLLPDPPPMSHFFIPSRKCTIFLCKRPIARLCPPLFESTQLSDHFPTGVLLASSNPSFFFLTPSKFVIPLSPRRFYSFTSGGVYQKVPSLFFPPLSPLSLNLIKPEQSHLPMRRTPLQIKFRHFEQARMGLDYFS